MLEGDDYMRRAQLMDEFDEMMLEHIRTGQVVVSEGLDVFRAGRDISFNSIFERAGQRMYERKKYLKSLNLESA